MSLGLRTDCCRSASAGKRARYSYSRRLFSRISRRLTLLSGTPVPCTVWPNVPSAVRELHAEVKNASVQCHAQCKADKQADGESGWKNQQRPGELRRREGIHFTGGLPSQYFSHQLPALHNAQQRVRPPLCGKQELMGYWRPTATGVSF